MANPKITVTLTVDQSVMDVLTAHTEALNRFCAMKPADVVPDDKSTIAPAEVGHTTEDVPAPVAPAIPTQTYAPAAEPAAPVMPVQVAAPVVEPVAPVIPVHTAPQAPIAAAQAFAIPVAPAAEITIESLMRAGVDLMNRGVNASAVLTEFGVQALTALPKERYPEFAARLRQLGANI